MLHTDLKSKISGSTTIKTTTYSTNNTTTYPTTKDKFGFKGKAYKSMTSLNISNLRIVSMIPGDRKVAGCFNYLQIPGMALQSNARFPIYFWRFI